MTIARESDGMPRFVTDEADGTLTLAGELDGADVGSLLTSLLGGDVTTDRRVDLSGVTFLDSMGLQTFLRARRLLATQDRRLLLLNRSDVVVHLFELTDVGDQFDAD